MAISRMLCSVAVLGVMLPTVPDPHRQKKNTGMERSGPTPSVPRRVSLPGGSGTGGLLRNATAAGLVLEHMHVLVCICAHLVPEQL